MKTAREILAPIEQQDEFTAWMLDDTGGMFIGAKKLPDGNYAGVIRLAFTHAIALGVTRQDVCQRRFCFEQYADMLDAYQKLKSINDEPVGWVASRPKQVEEDWLLIDSAPKDATAIRAARFEFGHCNYCRAAIYHNGWVEVDSSREGEYIEPTHWRPY